MSKITHIHIAIAEPSTIIREGIVSVVKRIDTLSVDIVEIPNLANFSDRLVELQPDVLIVNPTSLGLCTPNSLREELADYSLPMKVMALQSNIAEQDLSQLGYDDVISIYDSAESISTKLKAVVEKQSTEDAGADKNELSGREREIVVCVVKGMTNNQIAEELFLSKHTVIAHRRNISNKLQIHSPAGLTIYAIVNKLVDISEVKDSIAAK